MSEQNYSTDLTRYSRRRSPSRVSRGQGTRNRSRSPPRLGDRRIDTRGGIDNNRRLNPRLVNENAAQSSSALVARSSPGPPGLEDDPSSSSSIQQSQEVENMQKEIENLKEEIRMLKYQRESTVSAYEQQRIQTEKAEESRIDMKVKYDTVVESLGPEASRLNADDLAQLVSGLTIQANHAKVLNEEYNAEVAKLQKSVMKDIYDRIFDGLPITATQLQVQDPNKKTTFMNVLHTIPIEYEKVLGNLIDHIPNFLEKYPLQRDTILFILSQGLAKLKLNEAELRTLGINVGDQMDTVLAAPTVPSGSKFWTDQVLNHVELWNTISNKMVTPVHYGEDGKTFMKRVLTNSYFRDANELDYLIINDPTIPGKSAESKALKPVADAITDHMVRKVFSERKNMVDYLIDGTATGIIPQAFTDMRTQIQSTSMERIAGQLARTLGSAQTTSTNPTDDPSVNTIIDTVIRHAANLPGEKFASIVKTYGYYKADKYKDGLIQASGGKITQLLEPAADWSTWLDTYKRHIESQIDTKTLLKNALEEAFNLKGDSVTDIMDKKRQALEIEVQSTIASKLGLPKLDTKKSLKEEIETFMMKELASGLGLKDPPSDGTLVVRVQNATKIYIKNVLDGLNKFLNRESDTLDPRFAEYALAVINHILTAYDIKPAYSYHEAWDRLHDKVKADNDSIESIEKAWQNFVVKAWDAGLSKANEGLKNWKSNTDAKIGKRETITRPEFEKLLGEVYDTIGYIKGQQAALSRLMKSNE